MKYFHLFPALLIIGCGAAWSKADLKAKGIRSTIKYDCSDEVAAENLKYAWDVCRIGRTIDTYSYRDGDKYIVDVNADNFPLVDCTLSGNIAVCIHMAGAPWRPINQETLRAAIVDRKPIICDKDE